MITEESAILVMFTSLLGKICILPSKEAHFIPACYKLYLVAQFVGDEERNLHPSQGVYLMESAFPRDIRPNAHASRRVLTLHPKTGSGSFPVENLNLSHEQKKKGSREAHSSTRPGSANLEMDTPPDLKPRCQSQLLAF
jgi:hypothetical protein